MSAMTVVQLLPLTTPSAIESRLPALCHLLRDAVEGGASVGFTLPLDNEELQAYWHGVASQLDSGLLVWALYEGDTLAGSVQLSLCGKSNGRHRAEVQKLFVLQACRRRGYAQQLMAVVEQAAKAHGRHLLVLDTESGKPAVQLYRSLGYQFGGSIPDYAYSPDGELNSTEYYYKLLA